MEQKQAIDQLLHARYLITCEDHNQTLENHSLAIHQGKIVAILPEKEAKARFAAQEEKHFPHHAILPGFINAHNHLAMNLLRGLSDDISLMDWLHHHIWPAETKWLSHDFVYDGSLLAMAEMVRGGTTCCTDMYFYPEAVAESANLIGIRAHVGITIISVPTSWAKSADECFEKGLAFCGSYKNHPLVTPLWAPHSTYTVTLPELEKVGELAAAMDMKISIHLQEAHSEIARSLKEFDRRPLERINDIGLVSPRLIAVHMTQLIESDFAILMAKKPHLVHCPASNMKLASGAAPIERLLQAGINVALGTDGSASNNRLDMIEEMRFAALLGKLITEDPKAVGAEKVLQMATLHGARALGIDHLTGSLTIGKAADVIAIDFSPIETQPLYHPVSQIVYASSRFQVSDVWVAGKQLLKNRELVNVEMKDLVQRAKYWQGKLEVNEKPLQHQPAEAR